MKNILMLAFLFIAFPVFSQSGYNDLNKKEIRDIGPVAREYGEVIAVSKNMYNSNLSRVQVLVRRPDYGFHFSMLHFDKKRKLIQEVRWEIDSELYEQENRWKLDALFDRLGGTIYSYYQLRGPIVDLGLKTY